MGIKVISKFQAFANSVFENLSGSDINVDEIIMSKDNKEITVVLGDLEASVYKIKNIINQAEDFFEVQLESYKIDF